MKLKNFLVALTLALVGIVGVNQSYAKAIIYCSDEDKAYVSPEQIMVAHEGICILIEGEIVQVQAIMQDDKGLYYLKPSIYWTCRTCGYTKNPAWISYCKNCEKRYNEE